VIFVGIAIGIVIIPPSPARKADVPAFVLV